MGGWGSMGVPENRAKLLPYSEEFSGGVLLSCQFLRASSWQRCEKSVKGQCQKRNHVWMTVSGSTCIKYGDVDVCKLLSNS
jgi:hypothetical protein